jgi:hypothetical protein
VSFNREVVDIFDVLGQSAQVIRMDRYLLEEPILDKEKMNSGLALKAFRCDIYKSGTENSDASKQRFGVFAIAFRCSIPVYWWCCL